MKEFVRSLDMLVRDNPDLTGKEIIELQEQDKKEVAEWELERDKEQIAIVKDINENGAFYKGTFGLNQHYFRKILRAELRSDGSISIDIESIVIFSGRDEKRPINIEHKIDEFCDYDNYGFQRHERIDEKQFNEAIVKINSVMSLFIK